MGVIVVPLRGKHLWFGATYYCLARISGINNDEKGKFNVPVFLFWLVFTFPCLRLVKNIAGRRLHSTEIAQHGLEIIFKVLKSKNDHC